MQLGVRVPLDARPPRGAESGVCGEQFHAVPGLIGFAFPRLLIAMGVPLEEWIRLAERITSASAAEDINTDAILWAISIVLFVVLTG